MSQIKRKIRTNNNNSTPSPIPVTPTSNGLSLTFDHIIMPKTSSYYFDNHKQPPNRQKEKQLQLKALHQIEIIPFDQYRDYLLETQKISPLLISHCPRCIHYSYIQLSPNINEASIFTCLRCGYNSDKDCPVCFESDMLRNRTGNNGCEDYILKHCIDKDCNWREHDENRLVYDPATFEEKKKEVAINTMKNLSLKAENYLQVRVESIMNRMEPKKRKIEEKASVYIDYCVKQVLNTIPDFIVHECLGYYKLYENHLQDVVDQGTTNRKTTVVYNVHSVVTACFFLVLEQMNKGVSGDKPIFPVLTATELWDVCWKSGTYEFEIHTSYSNLILLIRKLLGCGDENRSQRIEKFFHLLCQRIQPVFTPTETIRLNAQLKNVLKQIEVKDPHLIKKNDLAIAAAIIYNAFTKVSREDKNTPYQLTMIYLSHLTGLETTVISKCTKSMIKLPPMFKK